MLTVQFISDTALIRGMNDYPDHQLVYTICTDDAHLEDRSDLAQLFNDDSFAAVEDLMPVVRSRCPEPDATRNPFAHFAEGDYLQSKVIT